MGEGRAGDDMLSAEERAGLASRRDPYELALALIKAEERLQESEAYAKEGWDWLEKALEALGAKTVFDIAGRKDAFAAAEAARDAALADAERLAEALDTLLEWERSAAAALPSPHWARDSAAEVARAALAEHEKGKA